MNDFYITLPSHSNTIEFTDNASNYFKIRLPHPIRLEGGGWKVGLAAVSLPDPMNRLPDLMKNENNVLFQAYWLATDTTTNPNTHRGYYANFQVRDLTKVNKLDDLDGLTLMNDVKTFFNKKKVEKSLRRGWKMADADGQNKTLPHFICEGGDFILHNVDVKLTKYSGTYYPTFHIKSELAVAMGWFVHKGGKNFGLGPNLILEIPDGTVPNPIDLASPSATKFWDYGSMSGLIDLSMTCNWRFTNVNKTLERVVSAHKRPLFIYSDVGRSSVVGNQVTDLLREVSYKREGKGSQYFEPLHIQYIPVRKDVLDIIETQVAETTSELTQFGSGNTIVTLHFKKT